MSLEDQYRLYVEAYYAVMEMDEYDLKIYTLKEIEELINNFKNEYDLNIDYKKENEYIKDNVSLKTKLQSSLIILNQINAPIELILLVKKRLKELK